MMSSRAALLLFTFFTYPLSLAPVLTPLLFLPELFPLAILKGQTLFLASLSGLTIFERLLFSYWFVHGRKPPLFQYYLLYIFISTFVVAGVMATYAPIEPSLRPWFFLNLLTFLIFTIVRTLNFSANWAPLTALWLSLTAQAFIQFCAVLTYDSWVDVGYTLLFSLGAGALVVQSLLVESHGTTSPIAEGTNPHYTSMAAMLWGLLPLAALVGVGGGRLSPLYLANLLPFLLIQRVLAPKALRGSSRLSQVANSIGILETALMHLFTVWLQLFCLVGAALLSYQIAHDTLGTSVFGGF